MRQSTIFPPISCRHCAARVSHPRWARVEHLYYIPLCWNCFDKLHQTFTADQAICQALIIVGIHQGKRRPLTIGGME